jgi:hypothetical protein
MAPHRPGQLASIPFIARFVDEEGRLRPNGIMEHPATAGLDELARAEAVQRPRREHAVQVA